MPAHSTSGPLSFVSIPLLDEEFDVTDIATPSTSLSDELSWDEEFENGVL
jgi:hypothetical protein